MPSTLRTVALLLMLATSLPASARTPQHDSCTVDPEMAVLQLPACALDTREGQNYVARPYLHLFDFSAPTHLASSSIKGMGWIYFNRQGRIVIKHVATMDNGPDTFFHGLIRVTAQGKWGLADSHGTLIVPLQYDGILDYTAPEGWSACTGCRTVVEGEHSLFQGGTWVSLDRLGHLKHPAAKNHP